MSEIFKAIPILRIFNEAKAREFYLGFLGFKVDWEHRFEDGLPLYLQISRGDLVLHLSEHHGDCCPGACIYVRTTGLADFHGESAPGVTATTGRASRRRPGARG